MSKYIDAEKLIAEIDKWSDGKLTLSNLSEIKGIITSLQQEQPEFPTTDEEVEKALASIPKVELPDKYKTPDWLFKQREQPEMELEKEYKSYMKSRKDDISGNAATVNVKDMARHFYELGRLSNK